MKRAIAFVATGLLLSNPANALQCASSVDQAALKTAAVQQQLMVAALSCHNVYEYNRFVLGHQRELINSDDALKAYFLKADKQHGTATYNKYKTELANAASLRSSQDPDMFCDAAAHEFDSVLRPVSLAAIVASADLIADAPGAGCPVYMDNRPTLALADRPDVRPSRVPDSEESVDTSGAGENWDADEESMDSADNPDAPGDLYTPRPHRAIDDSGH